MNVKYYDDGLLKLEFKPGLGIVKSTFPEPLVTVDHGDPAECAERERMRDGYVDADAASQGADLTGDVIAFVLAPPLVRQIKDALDRRAIEALEIAYDALLRTTRDESFGYEEKKAAEDYVRSVLKEAGVDV